LRITLKSKTTGRTWGLSLTLFAIFALLPATSWAQKVPAGFQAELIYKVPDIEHPSVVTCDDQGNLFVGEDPMDMRGPTSKEFDRVLFLKFDAEGKVVRKTVFCDKLSAVFGLVWHNDALYVMHAPHYTMFKDTDGDGVADVRKDLADGFGPPAGVYGFNDHIVTGTRLGMDGYVYVSVGDKGVPKATGADGSTITLEGGGVIRMRPDGTKLELVTSGTRNHLDVAMDSLDNIFTYDNTDDGLGWWTRFTHHVPTGYYGYPYDYHPHSERHLPRISEHGGGSPVGAACYREAYWPATYRDSPFFCEWGKGKIQRFKLTKKGASFESEIEDFMTKEGNEEFRPLDICFSPDGRHMYVADWNYGGWTNSKVAGRLYRVTYVGTDVTPEPARLPAQVTPENTTNDQLIAALGHPSHSERMRAQWILDRRSETGERSFQYAKVAGAASNAKIHGLWTLNAYHEAKGPTPQFSLELLAALRDADANVRAQAARAIGLQRMRDPEGQILAALTAALKDSEPTVRLQVAVALGRIGSVKPDVKWTTIDSGEAGVPVPRLDEKSLAVKKAGDREITKSLWKALGEDDVYVRHCIVQALRAINNWTDAPLVLHESSDAIRAGMLLALTGVYEEDAVAALEELALRGTVAEERAKAIEALAEVHHRADPYEKGWWGTQPARGKPARSKKNDWSGTSHVLEVLRKAVTTETPVPVKIAAIKVWRDVNDAGALPILRTVATSDVNADAKREAVITLAQLKDVASVPLFAQIAGDVASGDLLRQEAVRGITAIGSPEAVQQLISIVSNASSSVELTSLALEALAKLKNADSSAVVEARLADTRPAIRSGAIAAFGAIRGASAAARIAEMLKDSDVGVRKSTLTALSTLKVADTVPAMLVAAADETTKFEAQMALVAMPDRRALPFYLEGLTSPNADLRKASMAALVTLRDKIGDDIIKLHQGNELPTNVRGPLQAVFSAPAPVTKWQFAGSFPKDRELPKFDFAQAPEKAQQFEVGDKKFGWKEITADAKDGRADPGRHATGSRDGVWAMAYTEIVSETDGLRSFLIGSDDQVLVWVNGKKAYDFSANRGFTANQDRFTADLKKGVNSVWLQSGNDGGPWDFSLSVSHQDPRFAFLYENVQPQLDINQYREFALKNKGDADKGQKIFSNMQGVACIKCHSVQGTGGKIGPDLVGIALRYPKDELIRSVLEPSNRIASGYEVLTVLTNDGKVVNGLIKSDSPDGVELLDALGNTHKIKAADIDEKQRGSVSLMPNGLKDGMSLQDFADIVAYLESLKQQPEVKK
jgi:putative membrane-bound dehydrogenase-like protein